MYTLACTLFLCVIQTAYGQASASAILGRQTWNFTRLEAVEVKGMNLEMCGSLLIEIWTALEGDSGRLVAFDVIDLDSDGVYEVVQYWSAGGRTRGLAVGVLSRKQGEYYHGSFYDHSQNGIQTFNQNRAHFLVGHDLALDTCIACRLYTYPVIYRWKDMKLQVVSHECRDYYEHFFVPEVKETLCKREKEGARQFGDQRDEIEEIVGWALAVNKVNAQFEKPVVGDLEKKRFAKLLQVFVPQSEEEKNAVSMKVWLDALNAMRSSKR